MSASVIRAAADRVEASLAGSWDDFGRTVNRHDVRTLLHAVRPAPVCADSPAAEGAAVSLAAEDLMLLARLRQARVAAGLTQEQLAVRMGAPVTAVTTTEAHDADPTLSMIRRYALAVGAMVHHAVQPNPHPQSGPRA